MLTCYVLDSAYELDKFNITLKLLLCPSHLGWGTASYLKKKKKTIACIERIFVRSKEYICNNEFTVGNSAF